jgi:hypothetical protein
MLRWRDLVHGVSRSKQLCFKSGKLTPRIGLAPKNHRPVLVFRRPEDIMELYSEAVQVSDVQWPKIMVESIV